MALFQQRDKCVLGCLLIVMCGVWLQLSEACHPNSKALHICLNIYLERDFPLIETIIKSSGRRGRVLLEGPDLENICRDIGKLRNCFKALLHECDSYWQLDRFTRMMIVLRDTHYHLCNDSQNILDLLMNSGCLVRAKEYISHCPGFNWMTSWREVLRMQVSPIDRCSHLDTYKTCLLEQLQNMVCGQNAIKVYGDLLNLWLRSWCNKDSTPQQNLAYFYKSLTESQDLVR